MFDQKKLQTMNRGGIVLYVYGTSVINGGHRRQSRQHLTQQQHFLRMARQHLKIFHRHENDRQLQCLFTFRACLAVVSGSLRSFIFSPSFLSWAERTRMG